MTIARYGLWIVMYNFCLNKVDPLWPNLRTISCQNPSRIPTTTTLKEQHFNSPKTKFVQIIPQWITTSAQPFALESNHTYIDKKTMTFNQNFIPKMHRAVSTHVCQIPERKYKKIYIFTLWKVGRTFRQPNK